MVVAAIAGIVRYAWRNGAERCGQSMRRIAAVMVLALAALAGPGLTGAKPAVAADAMLSSPGLAGTSASPAVTGTRLWVQRFAGPGSGDDLANSPPIVTAMAGAPANKLLPASGVAGAAPACPKPLPTFGVSANDCRYPAGH